MYSEKQRAELADICYMTVEREASKPLGEMNTALIDRCITLANKLLGIEELSAEDIASVKAEVKRIKVRRPKKLRIRIIAAVLALLLLLGGTVYAGPDWIVKVFGLETIQNIQPGDKIEVNGHSLEAPEDILYFDSPAEVVEYVGEPTYMPGVIPEGYEMVDACLYVFEDAYIDITWHNGANRISWMVRENPNFYGFEYNYYSPEGYGFIFIEDTPDHCQASAWIDGYEYIILANNTDILKALIDNMVLVE